MFCRHCGKQIEDNAKVCRSCGTPVQGRNAKGENDRRQGENREKKSGKTPKKKGGSGIVIGILIGAIVLVLLGGVGFFAWTHFSSEDKESTRQEEDIDRENGKEDGDEESGREKSGENQEESGRDESQEGKDEPASEELPAGALSDSEQAKTIAKYNSESGSAAVIDVFADNYTPGARNFDYAWDRNLFYTLEDVNPNSASDGMINGYNITRKILKNAVSNNKMEYEIYTNPSTGRVNKIVSIEYFPTYLEITDYYYDDYGKVSFIFVRNDVNYVPSYAVPTKDGQRFYFNSDCMTKWRVVSGGVQSNYVIGQTSADEGSNPAGSVFIYASMNDDAQTNYDIMEKRMINAVYNTYNIVLAAEGLSEITGYVYDEAGNPAQGASVVLAAESGENLYKSETDSSGMYRIVVPSKESTYRLLINKDGCVPSIIYSVKVSSQTLSDYQNPVYMVAKNGEQLPVQLKMYDALNYASDGSGMERLSNAAVYIRDGVNHREGGVVAQGTADANGVMNLSLTPGMYTAQITKQGYDDTYYNFAAKEGMEAVQINASPRLAEGEVRVVLSWGYTPRDLDSHLFTPYDNSFGDNTYHIWYGNKQDAVGNNLDVDDTDSYGPETMTIPVLKNGLYKYYIADYTNCSAGNQNSYDLSNSGAVVNVYTSNGLTAAFTVPSNRPGVIWEVFEIRNGAIVPIQRYYSNIDDKNWWHSDK